MDSLLLAATGGGPDWGASTTLGPPHSASPSTSSIFTSSAPSFPMSASASSSSSASTASASSGILHAAYSLMTESAAAAAAGSSISPLSSSSASSAAMSISASSPPTPSSPPPPFFFLRPQPPPAPQIDLGPEVFIYGFVLVLIPTATILGNFLVIISVLRFKALHSAINFLILGLAIADLMVALFVMPYAVYVYIQGGHWLLGPLMCNLYLSSDVACSTASIILLALISFDRYKAISKPIQYSRQAQDICRVVKLFVGVWLYSFAVASPIVLGFNEPTVADSISSPYECRFYNAYFQLLSSLVSFVLPCCIVIFVYVRIIRALRRRERAAKLRKAQQHLAAQSAVESGIAQSPRPDCEEAGEIVAGPAVNMMMIALPSLNRQIKRYERHKRALEEVEGGELEYELSSSDSLSEDVRILTNDFLSEVPTNNSKTSTGLEPPQQRGSFLISRFRASFSGVLEPRKKLSVVQADEIVPSIFAPPRKRSCCDVGNFFPPQSLMTGADRRRSGAAVLRSRSNREDCRRVDEERQRRLMTLKEEEKSRDREKSEDKEKPAPPKEVEQQEKPTVKCHKPVKATLSFPLVRRLTLGRDIRVNHYFLTGVPDGASSAAGSQRSSRANSQRMCNGGNGLNRDKKRRKSGESGSPKGTQEKQERQSNRWPKHHPTPNNSIKGAFLQNGNLLPGAFKMANLVPAAFGSFRRGSSAIELTTNGTTTASSNEPVTSITVLPVEEVTKLDIIANQQPVKMAASVAVSPPTVQQCSKTQPPPPPAEEEGPVTSQSLDEEEEEEDEEPFDAQEFVRGRRKRRPTKVKDAAEEEALGESGREHLLQRSVGGGGGQSCGTGGGGSRKDRRHASLRRKVHKSQRKEKRATKTLGIVVGTFLCCWVPFFSLNIVNALCLELRAEWCQIGFGPFFYTTWIGYMNSFMNPVIYTIFNAEFRRAFKSLLLGRRAGTGMRRMI